MRRISIWPILPSIVANLHGWRTESCRHSSPRLAIVADSMADRWRPTGHAAYRADLEEHGKLTNQSEPYSRLANGVSVEQPEPPMLELRRSCLGPDAPRGCLVAGAARCTR